MLDFFRKITVTMRYTGNCWWPDVARKFFFYNNALQWANYCAKETPRCFDCTYTVSKYGKEDIVIFSKEEGCPF